MAGIRRRRKRKHVHSALVAVLEPSLDRGGCHRCRGRRVVLAVGRRLQCYRRDVEVPLSRRAVIVVKRDELHGLRSGRSNRPCDRVVCVLHALRGRAAALAVAEHREMRVRFLTVRCRVRGICERNLRRLRGQHLVGHVSYRLVRRIARKPARQDDFLGEIAPRRGEEHARACVLRGDCRRNRAERSADDENIDIPDHRNVAG